MGWNGSKHTALTRRSCRPTPGIPFFRSLAIDVKIVFPLSIAGLRTLHDHADATSWLCGVCSGGRLCLPLSDPVGAHAGHLVRHLFGPRFSELLE